MKEALFPSTTRLSSFSIAKRLSLEVIYSSLRRQLANSTRKMLLLKSRPIHYRKLSLRIERISKDLTMTFHLIPSRTLASSKSQNSAMNKQMVASTSKHHPQVHLRLPITSTTTTTPSIIIIMKVRRNILVLSSDLKFASFTNSTKTLRKTFIFSSQLSNSKRISHNSSNSKTFTCHLTPLFSSQSHTRVDLATLKSLLI
jgi:BarA-like signal transduction histidine kinase